MRLTSLWGVTMPALPSLLLHYTNPLDHLFSLLHQSGLDPLMARAQVQASLFSFKLRYRHVEHLPLGYRYLRPVIQSFRPFSLVVAMLTHHLDLNTKSQVPGLICLFLVA